MADADPIRVLIVEDEPLTAEAHAAYLGRLAGFEHVGTAPNGQTALRMLAAASAAEQPVALVLMDMNLPDLHGLDVSRRVRAANLDCDIIAITAVRELQVVRGAVAAGVVQYLIKPFSYATFAEKLTSYREFRERLAEQSRMTSQSSVDEAFNSLRTPSQLSLPKGLAGTTLTAVADLLMAENAPASAAELSERLGISRVTVRRYLEHLADAGSVVRSPRYGTPGRPENEYSWRR